MGLIVFVVALVFIIPNVINAIKEAERRDKFKREQEEQLRREREKKQKEDEQKQQALQQQKDLVVRYKNSKLIAEVIQTICDGDPERILPTQIVITNTYIQGTTNGRTLTYNFAEHRIKPLPTIIKTVVGWDELKYVVKPQVAMADALNLLLDNRYVIQKISKEDFSHHTDCDGDSYTLVTYTSDYVTMVLKSALPNKEF